MTREQYKILTLEQKVALRSVYVRNITTWASATPSDEPCPEYEDLINRAQHTIGCDGAISVPFAGMFLLIEKDGYTHS